jgi:hypothetical protein
MSVGGTQNVTDSPSQGGTTVVESDTIGADFREEFKDLNRAGLGNSVPVISQDRSEASSSLTQGANRFFDSSHTTLVARNDKKNTEKVPEVDPKEIDPSLLKREPVQGAVSIQQLVQRGVFDEKNINVLQARYLLGAFETYKDSAGNAIGYDGKGLLKFENGKLVWGLSGAVSLFNLQRKKDAKVAAALEDAQKNAEVAIKSGLTSQIVADYKVAQRQLLTYEIEQQKIKSIKYIMEQFNQPVQDGRVATLPLDEMGSELANAQIKSTAALRDLNATLKNLGAKTGTQLTKENLQPLKGAGLDVPAGLMTYDPQLASLGVEGLKKSMNEKNPIIAFKRSMIDVAKARVESAEGPNVDAGIIGTLNSGILGRVIDGFKSGGVIGGVVNAFTSIFTPNLSVGTDSAKGIRKDFALTQLAEAKGQLQFSANDSITEIEKSLDLVNGSGVSKDGNGNVIIRPDAISYLSSAQGSKSQIKNNYETYMQNKKYDADGSEASTPFQLYRKYRDYLNAIQETMNNYYDTGIVVARLNENAGNFTSKESTNRILAQLEGPVDTQGKAGTSGVDLYPYSF